jgi:hypothetical protein
VLPMLVTGARRTNGPVCPSVTRSPSAPMHTIEATWSGKDPGNSGGFPCGQIACEPAAARQLALGGTVEVAHRRRFRLRFTQLFAQARSNLASKPAQTDAPRNATRSLSWRVSPDLLKLAEPVRKSR